MMGQDFAALLNSMLEAGADPDTALGTGGIKPSVTPEVDVTKPAADMLRPLPALWFSVEYLHIDLTAILLHHGASVDPWSPDADPQPGSFGWSALQG